MTGSVQGQQAIPLLQGWLGEVEVELADIDDAIKTSRERRSTVTAEHEAAWAHLTQLMVPDVLPVHLDEAAGRIGLPMVSAEQTTARTEARRADLEATLADVDAKFSSAGRTFDANAASIRLYELRELRLTLESGLRPLEEEPLWAHLLASSYGTEHYPLKFWHLSYYQNWKEADRIVEVHGPALGVAKFSDIRTRYLSQKEAWQTIANEERELNELVRRHTEATTGLVNLPTWTLSTTWAFIRQHLEPLEDPDLLALFADQPALLIAAKRVAGTRAKGRYLDGLEKEWLREAKGELQVRRRKLHEGMAKLARPKHSTRQFTKSELESKYASRPGAWAKRRQRYHEVSERIVVYRSYETSPLENFLWWDLMTGGHRHGIHEVDVWHQRHGHGAVGDAYAAGLQDRADDQGWSAGQDVS